MAVESEDAGDGRFQLSVFHQYQNRGRFGMTTVGRTQRILMISALTVMFLAASAVTGLAQHLISTRAGFVNRTDGKVYVTRFGNVDEERGRASLGTQMRQGDQLSTESGSFAEVLLTPGAYLRLDQKSTVRAVNTDLQSVQFELVEGSAILEVGEVERQAPLLIITRHGQFYVRKDGLHRFDLMADATKVGVRQGELWTGSREEVLASKGTKIGRGKLALFRGAELPGLAVSELAKPELAKIDRDAFDNFDVWSFGRAQTLVSANNSALSQSRSNNALSYGWYFDAFSGGYTFIPRNGMFWSPYGFGFFNSFSNCFTCMNGLNRGYGSMYGGRGNGGGQTILNPNNPSAPGRVITGVDRTPIQREIEGRRVDLSTQMDASIGGGRGMGMGGNIGRSASMPESVILAAPAPSRGVSAGGGAAPARPSRN
jgi:hypothetical protein